MGLSSQLADVSSDSIPILILINAVRGVSYIRYLFFCLMHTVVGLGLSPHQSEASSSSSSSSSSVVGSGLAGLAVLADHLASNRPFAWAPQTTSTTSSSVGPAASSCVVCLEGLGEGERVRRLACCHVFHSDCLDGWMVGEMNLSCPLCRSPVAAEEERRADAERRIGAELVAWLSPY